MELLMENKGKFIDKYLFNLKFTVAITGLKNVMSCCIDVHYLLITDMICSMACQEV